MNIKEPIKSSSKGFTLIELLIVVAIIGILAAVGVAVIPNILNKAKVTAVKVKHEKIFNYISIEIFNCYDLRGMVTVIGSGGVIVQADCSIDPFVQLPRASIYGSVSGYVDGIVGENKTFGVNPFDPNHHEAGYRHMKLLISNPNPILGMTNCAFHEKGDIAPPVQETDILYCWSRFAKGNDGVITSTYRFD